MLKFKDYSFEDSNIAELTIAEKRQTRNNVSCLKQKYIKIRYSISVGGSLRVSQKSTI